MALERLLNTTAYDGPAGDLYTEIEFPQPPLGRAYVFANMVATLDGKTLIGPRGSTAKGVGGPTDQLLMRRLEQKADAAIIGSSTLRAGSVIYPPEKLRAVITRSGDLPLDNRFFTDAPDRAVVFAPQSLPATTREQIKRTAELRQLGEDAVDVGAAVRLLREEFGVNYLLLEGGASTNWEFLVAGVLDELFLTIGPRLKGGANLPTIIDGPGFPDRKFAEAQLLSLYRDEDELYLRYRITETNVA